MQPIFNTKPDTSQTFFRSFPIDQRSVGTLLLPCLLHFFTSFLLWQSWLSVQKNNAKWFYRMVLQMGIQVDSRGHADWLEVPFKNLKRSRWLTIELKPEEILGSHPSVGQLFPSKGLLKSSIMKNFILPLNVGWKPQQWSEFGRIA